MHLCDLISHLRFPFVEFLILLRCIVSAPYHPLFFDYSVILTPCPCASLKLLDKRSISFADCSIHLFDCGKYKAILVGGVSIIRKLRMVQKHIGCLAVEKSEGLSFLLLLGETLLSSLPPIVQDGAHIFFRHMEKT